MAKNVLIEIESRWETNYENVDIDIVKKVIESGNPSLNIDENLNKEIEKDFRMVNYKIFKDKDGLRLFKILVYDIHGKLLNQY